MNDDEDFSLGISRLADNQQRGGDYYPLTDQFTNSNNINDSEGIEMLNEPNTNSVIHLNARPSKNDNIHQEEQTLLLERNNSPLPPVHNLDSFLTDVYNYFRGKGFLCKVSNGLLELISSLFVVLFFTFLVSFVNYSVVFGNDSQSSLGESVDFTRKIPLWLIVFLGIFSMYWLYKLGSFLYELKTSLEMKSFYSNVLHIDEDEIQTAEWREIVMKLSKVKRLSNVSDTLSALEIANRIMRKDNYLIHIVNANILNLNLPFTRYKFVTKSIEWCLVYSLFNYIFDENGVVKKEFLDIQNRGRLSTGLQRRFFAIGLIGLFATPFIFFFLVINFFFEYANDLKNNPSSLFSREWTPYAKWQFREFNELPHYFQNRLNLSYIPANEYVSSFPSEFLSHVARFVSFILSSFLAVLILFGIWNDNFLLNYQIFGRTAIWYVGIIGTAVAVARALVTDSNQVFQPVKYMARTYQYTHYLPKSWKGKSHTHRVRDEFLSLFEYKLATFIKEILSVIFAPFILMFSLPSSASAIINEVATGTVNAEGLGYVCLSATFTNVKRLGGTHKYGTFSANTPNVVQNKQGKVIKSMANFKAHNPEWKPVKNEYFDDITKFVEMKDGELNNHQPISSVYKSAPSLHGAIPPNTSVDDFQFIYDSHYINPKIFRSVMGDPDDEETNIPAQVDQNLIDMVNSVQDSFYQYSKSQSKSNQFK